MSTNPKVSIGDVAECLKQSNATPALIRQTIEALNLKVAKAEEGKEEKPPALKMQSVVVLSDPEGRLKGHDYVAWIMQIEESGSPSTVLERIKHAAATYNETRKGKLYPVKSVGEALESIPRKGWATDDPGSKTTVKTREPVLVVPTSNALS